MTLAALAAGVLCFGCSDSTTPGTPAGSDRQAQFEGALDPSTSTFQLRRVAGSEPGQAPVALDLIGSNLVIDPVQETVSLDVALRNSSSSTLHAPALVWLSRLQPAGVTVLNADHTEGVGTTSQIAFPQPSGEPGPRYGFDYSLLLGGDATLQPGETSGAKTWRFHVPGLTSFSFAALATFGGEPGGSVIAGSIFTDSNANGVRDPGETRFGGGLTLLRPDGVTMSASTDDSGQYSFPIADIGLHVVTYVPPALGCACDVIVTTPNPLQIVILPDANGQPQSYLHADFGARVVPLGGLPPPVVLTDRPPEQIPQDFYQLLSIERDGDILALRVGFSGCSPDHDFTLYMVGGFMESNPVQARLLLSHDAHGEMCLAYWERVLRFDLSPIRVEFERLYGQPGPVLLKFTDFQGQAHPILYVWGPPSPGTNLLSNGSFELNGQATLAGWVVNNSALTSLQPEPAPGQGAWSLKLAADWAPTSGFVLAPVGGVAPGDVLRLSAWVRAVGPNGGGALRFFTGPNHGTPTWSSEWVTSTSPAWTQLSVEGAVGGSATGVADTLWVELSSLITEIMQREGLFDGVVLERVTAGAATAR